MTVRKFSADAMVWTKEIFNNRGVPRARQSAGTDRASIFLDQTGRVPAVVGYFARETPTVDYRGDAVSDAIRLLDPGTGDLRP